MDYSNLKIPNHVGIILDGNGRWAQSKNKTRSEGHKAGFENLKKLSTYILSKGIKILSVYAFSTENFKRSKEEVDYLMDLFVKKFKTEKSYFKKNNVKVVFSGIRKSPLPDDVIDSINGMEEYTKDCNGGILNICINYGSHAEIIDAVKKINEDVLNKKLDINALDEKIFNSYLYQDLDPIDLLTRTSGELRLSNFMLWQNSYAEFYFPNVHFPDFNEKEFDKAILEYTSRDRRFGGIKYEEKSN